MKKFIISNQGELILGDVVYHRDLLPSNQYSCHGGGFWEVDNNNKILYLSGSSSDFGYPNFDYLVNVPIEYDNYKILYEGEVIINNINYSSAVECHTKYVDKLISERINSGVSYRSNIDKGFVHNFKFNDGYECKAKNKKEAERKHRKYKRCKED